MSDFIERQESKGISEINKFIDGLEEIFADLRERHVDDSVCGLCEYDGAYMGQSGDWCNECPGFDKDDCFKLSDECRKRWMGDIALPSVQPDHVADISKKVSISCGQENDLISRQATIDALWKALYEYEDKTEKQFQESEDLDVGDWIGHRIFVQNMNDIDRQTILNLPPAQPEIIRCKDCKWCEDADGLMCKNTASWVVATDCDFGCVCAERRTDGWHNQQTGRD